MQPPTSTKQLGGFVGIVNESSLFDKATELHRKAIELCFIANSVNFQIHHNPSIKITEY